MQINNLLFNFIKQNMPRDSFEENSIIEGKIISLEDGVVTLEVNGEILRAKTDLDLLGLLGQTMDFIIEEKTDTRLVIKPLTQDSLKELSKTMETTINKVIKEFKLEASPLIEDFIGELIHDKLPLSKENIEMGSRILVKLEELIAAQPGDIELVELGPGSGEASLTSSLEPNLEKLEELITRLDQPGVAKESKMDQVAPRESSLKDLSPKLGQDLGPKDLATGTLTVESNEKVQIRTEVLKILMDTGLARDLSSDLDIKHLLLVKNPEAKGEDSLKLAEGLGEKLDYIRSQAGEKDLVDLAKFFVKNKINPSLNNIRFSLELLKEPEKFAGKLRSIVDKTLDDKFLNRLLSRDMEELLDQKDRPKLSKEVANLLGKLDLKEADKKELQEIRDRLNFIKEVNKEMYFQNISLDYGKDQLAGFFNVIKEKENEFGAKKPISIFINLNTNNLGTISMSCLAFNKDLILKIGIKEEDQDLFKAMETVLRKRIAKLDYKLLSLDLVYDKDIKVLESVDKGDSIYFLDIKV